MDNLSLWEKVRTVPPTALKDIQAGRLKGKSDINPVWRLKTLTEQFGPCGFGWKYEITEKRLEPGANGEIAAFVDINLYVFYDGKWSEPIPGTGGSSFVANEKNGLYVSDECFKMALTDAISVSCKALGFGADVYWDKDKTKYSGRPQNAPQAPQDTPRATPQEEARDGVDRITARKALFAKAKELGFSEDSVKDYIKEWYDVTSTASLNVQQLEEAAQKLIEEDRRLAEHARKAEQGSLV